MVLPKSGLWSSIWRGLFPSGATGVIFMAYMALFVNQGLLVTASRRGSDSYPYNPTLVVLITEIFKLTLVTIIYVSK